MVYSEALHLDFDATREMLDSGVHYEAPEYNGVRKGRCMQ